MARSDGNEALPILVSPDGGPAAPTLDEVTVVGAPAEPQIRLGVLQVADEEVDRGVLRSKASAPRAVVPADAIVGLGRETVRRLAEHLAPARRFRRRAEVTTPGRQARRSATRDSKLSGSDPNQFADCWVQTGMPKC